MYRDKVKKYGGIDFRPYRAALVGGFTLQTKQFSVCSPELASIRTFPNPFASSEAAAEDWSRLIHESIDGDDDVPLGERSRMFSADCVLEKKRGLDINNIL